MGRGLEHALRTGLLHALSVATRNPGPIAPPDWDARSRSALLLRPDAVGDLILTTGLIRAIHERHPTLSIDVLTVANNAPVLTHDPHVRRVHSMDASARLGHYRWLPALRRAHYDAVVDGAVARPEVKTRTILQMLALGAPYRVGVTGRANDLFYTLAAPHPARPGVEAHQVELLRSLGAPFGIAPDADISPRLYTSSAERAEAERRWTEAAATAGVDGRGPRVLVNVSVSPIRAPRRRWAADRFVGLAAHVRAAHPDAALVVLALPHDALTAAAAAGAGVGLAAVTTLRDTFALVEAADAVFSPDTGVVHVASAFRTPTVVATLPEALSFTPYATPGAVLVATGNVLDDISLARVTTAMDETIEQYGRQRAARRG